MPFSFPLQPLLRYRRSLEHQRELALQAAHYELARTQQELERLQQFWLRSRRQLLDQARSGSTGAEMQFAAGWEQRLRDYSVMLAQQIERQQAARDLRMAEFQHARREREVLESLRDQQWRDYQEQERRREQALLDEAHLLRRYAAAE